MKNKNETTLIYETDDIEKAFQCKDKNVSVVYHNPNSTIPPILKFKTDGRIYSKYNPQYIEYLKKKYPGISDEQIVKCIEEAISQQSNLSQLDKIETYDSTKTRKK